MIAGSGSALAASGWTTAVRSQPGFRVPRVIVTARDANVAPGFIFLTPRTIYPGRTGPTILDKDGHVVWFHRQSYRLSAQNLRPQIYRGQPVLTWSLSPPLLREGEALTRGATPRNTYNVIADQSYRTIKRVRAVGRGVITNGHDFVITRKNTALVLGSRLVPRRLKRYGGPASGRIVDDLVQEIDIRTGRVLFSWSSAAHIPLSESMVRFPKTGYWDPFHLNSVSADSDGGLLVSARHTSTVYKISRHTGHIVWKLGGRHSSFRMGPGASFYYQHDAERQADGTITLFDNGATLDDLSHGRDSQAKRLRLDKRRKTATLVTRFKHPSGRGLASSQGNASVLANGDVFVGWGISPWFSEYAADGRLLFGARFSSVWHHSYRAYKAPWSARPLTKPAVYARVTSGHVAAYVSWNGATDVANWRLLGGADQNSLSASGTAPWANFETKLAFEGTPAFVQVQGLDANGAVLGASAVVKTQRG
ncbi:MAG TPA: arylsulfotransferase family protein [Thermoleophilaceae bacterium]|nr:arylsulfotransferase family protein [Thermoleophilaceae bacterium]